MGYILRGRNDRWLSGDGAPVIDVLPAGVSMVSAPACVTKSGTVTCPVGPLAVGPTRSFVVKVKWSAPCNGAIH